MTTYFIDEGINQAQLEAQREVKYAFVGNQPQAVELMEKSIEGNVTLAAVQGPPGTGKTSVVEAFAERKLVDLLASNERVLVVYVAPTNHLVFEAFQRISRQLIRAGYDPISIFRSLRVYGSKIRPFRSRSNPRINVDVDLIQKTMGAIEVDEVRFVFTTEFQRISYRLSDVNLDRIHIVVDEASKSPYFRVFLPLADMLVRHPEQYPSSMLVLGDPQQAITVSEEFREYNIPLLMEYVKRVLRRNNLFGERWVMLDTSFRLPRPSEEPISEGYYDGMLNAYYSASERLSKIRDSIIDNRNKILRILDSCGINVTSEETRKIIDSIETAASDLKNAPLVLAETNHFLGGDTFDDKRVKPALVASAYLQAASKLGGNAFSVAVTAPYSDLVNAISFRFDHKRLSPRIGKPRSVTVQSVIGGEADVIVTMLGKEWSFMDSRFIPPSALSSEYRETIYPREPELLNVQLSRHRTLMIVIGNLGRLRRLQADHHYQFRGVERIRKTIHKMSELVEEGSAVYSKLHNIHSAYSLI